MSVEDIAKHIGVDTLGYLSIEGLKESIGLKPAPLLTEVPEGSSTLSDSAICQACFDGDYPTDVPTEADKFMFEKQ
jgi:amidophosphoribosyltransferase